MHRLSLHPALTAIIAAVLLVVVVLTTPPKRRWTRPTLSLLALLAFGLAVSLYRATATTATKEAFGPQTEREAAAADANNYVLKLVSQLKHVSGKLTDVGMWKDRIEMSRMTPSQLARRSLGIEKKK